jgi:hypothetical protein
MAQQIALLYFTLISCTLLNVGTRVAYSLCLLGYWLDDLNFESRQDQEVFLFLKECGLFLGLPGLLFTSYWRLFDGDKVDWS